MPGNQRPANGPVPSAKSLPKAAMILVTAWLLVELATITGGSPPATAAFAQSEATTDSTSVVLPVPDGPLTASTSPACPATRCAKASRWAGANAYSSPAWPKRAAKRLPAGKQGSSGLG
ncbi:hypothetical protein D3C79_915530 [compost metagenome]